MSTNKENKSVIMGEGSVLRGNFAPRGANDPELRKVETEKSEEVRQIEEFEQAARDRIGGSIAFVTRLKNNGGDALLWDEDED